MCTACDALHRSVPAWQPYLCLPGGCSPSLACLPLPALLLDLLGSCCEAAALSPVQGCQMVVITNTRELGVQTALLVYKLFGGSISHGIPGNQ